MKKLFSLVAFAAIAFAVQAQHLVPIDVPGYYFKQVVPSVFHMAQPEDEYNRLRYDFFSAGERKMTSYVYNMDYLLNRNHKYVDNLRSSLLRGRGVTDACQDIFNKMKEFGERRCSESDIQLCRTSSGQLNLALLHIRTLIGYWGYAAIYFTDDASLVFYVKDIPESGTYVNEKYLLSHLQSIDFYDPYKLAIRPYHYYNAQLPVVAVPPMPVVHPKPTPPPPHVHKPAHKPAPVHKPAPAPVHKPKPAPKPKPRPHV